MLTQRRNLRNRVTPRNDAAAARPLTGLEKAGLVALMCWSVVQVVAAVQVDLAWIGLLRRVKTLVGPACIVLMWAVTRRRLRTPAPLVLLLVFALGSALSAMVREEPAWLVSLMYAGWGFSVATLLPSLMGRPRLLHGFVVANTLAILAASALAAALVWIEEGEFAIVSSTGRVRYSIGMNPQYAAKISAALLLNVVALLFVFRQQRYRRLLWLVGGVAALATVLTDARTQMLFVLVFAAAFTFQFGGKLRALAGVLTTLSLMVGALVWFELNTVVYAGPVLDEFSSGRTVVWGRLLRYNLPMDDPLRWLLGNGLTQWPAGAWEGRGDYLTHRHADNLYLDTLFSSGLIGVLLLGLALASWFTRLGLAARSGDDGVELGARFVRAVIIAMAVAALTDTLAPSFGNLFNSDVLVIAVGLTALAARGGGRATRPPRSPGAPRSRRALVGALRPPPAAARKGGG